MPSSSPSWTDLHDAVLFGIHFDWVAGEVEIVLDPSEASGRPTRPLRVEARGVTQLLCPRLDPWGRSDYVNVVREREDGSARRLEIEVQSGDTIVLVAASIVLS